MCFNCKAPSFRRVDRVFPRDDSDAPRKDALQHLSWYGLSHARKLPKIARYLARRIKAAAARGQYARVSVGVQVFDELVRTCHTEMRLFLQQYLNVILDLLTSDHSYHVLAVESFERFATIDADTPVYEHMCHEFIRVFASLCWCTEPRSDETDDKTIRMSGLRGLSAVVEKDRDMKSGSVLYDEHSLSQVIPALLFNVTQADHVLPSSLIVRRRGSGESDTGEEREMPTDAPQMASRVLQTICEHASVATTKPVLRPLFGYLADFGLWEEREDGAAAYVVTLVLSSLQGQLIHIVCDELVRHLDTRDALGALAKRSVIKAISTVCTSASSIPFTYILNIYNTILAHLRKPLPGASAGDRQLLEDSIVAACADVASNLPPTQKINILITILTKVPTTAEAKAKHQLVECARGAANTLQVQSLSSALPDALLKPLLQACTYEDEDVQTSASALLYDLLQCPLEVVSSRALTTATSTDRSLSSHRSSVGSLILDSVKSVVARPSGDVSAASSAQSLKASHSDTMFVTDKLRFILWHVYEAVAKTSSAGCGALEHLGNTAVHLGAYFGLAAMATVCRTVIALQRPPSPAQPVQTAFAAVVLKRIAFSRGATRTAAYVDDVVASSADVQAAARAMGPRDVFDFSTADEDGSDAAALFDADELVRRFESDGIKGDDVKSIATLEYIHAGSASEVETTSRRRPQLRPLIRVDSSEDMSEEGGQQSWQRNRQQEHISFAQLCSWRTGPPEFGIRPTDADVFDNIPDDTVAEIAGRVLKHRTSTRPCTLLSEQWAPVTASPLGF